MITKQILKQIAPNSKDEIIDPLVKYLNIHMPTYEVNTHLRVCHFLAQAAHESASFKTLREYASGAAYEGRKDLGNIRAGDGVRFRGRGIFQLTGRDNYRKIGAVLGFDLENNPNLAESPEISVLTALEYWKSRKLNVPADRDQVEFITRRINGGLNGFEDRKKYLARAKRVIPKDFKFVVKEEPKLEVPKEDPSLIPAPPINPLFPPIVVAKIGDVSPYIADLQNMLVKKGYPIVADGNFGPKTEEAVKNFQMVNNLTVSGSIDTDTLNRMMV